MRAPRRHAIDHLRSRRDEPATSDPPARASAHPTPRDGRGERHGVAEGGSPARPPHDPRVETEDLDAVYRVEDTSL